MTVLHLDVGGRRVRADSAAARSLAIRLDFRDYRRENAGADAQPNFFAAPVAAARTYAAGAFTGDTRRGGSCNVGTYSLTPHCNGTHTECVGHIVDDAFTLADLACDPLLPATLISVTAGAAAVSREQLKTAWHAWPDRSFQRALIVRTRPNDPDKTRRRYAAAAPPAWLDSAAMHLIRERGVQHLLIDLPSLDAMDDATLAAHRIFWGLPANSRALRDAAQPQATVTEMIYAGDDIADGYYLLNLQWPAFATDAAPSRPVIFPLEDA